MSDKTRQPKTPSDDQAALETQYGRRMLTESADVLARHQAEARRQNSDTYRVNSRKPRSTRWS